MSGNVRGRDIEYAFDNFSKALSLNHVTTKRKRYHYVHFTEIRQQKLKVVYYLVQGHKLESESWTCLFPKSELFLLSCLESM